MSFYDIKNLRNMLIFGICLFFIGEYVYPAASSLSAGVFGATLLLGIFYYMDDKVYKGIDTKKEIVVEKNMVFAYHLRTIAYLIIAGFIGAMLVFFTLKT